MDENSPKRLSWAGLGRPMPTLGDNALHSGGPAGALMNSFDQLQAQLGRIWALNRPGVGVDHVLVALPSFSVGESLLSHYASRIPALEHRYLVAHLLLHRIKACELVFLTLPTSRSGGRGLLHLAGAP